MYWKWYGSPVRNSVTAARYFASLYDIVSRRWPSTSFGLLSVAERKVKDGPRARKPPIKSKGGRVHFGKFRTRVPLRFVCRHQSATEKIYFDLDRRRGGRVLSVSCVLEIEVSTRGRRSGELSDCVRSFVRGERFASIGLNKFNTLPNNFQME